MDIAMCKLDTCPLKETCKRFKGQPDPYGQYYGKFEYKDGKCEYYWEIKEDTVLTNKQEWEEFNKHILNTLKEINDENK